jgi:hypothetical protein
MDETTTPAPTETQGVEASTQPTEPVVNEAVTTEPVSTPQAQNNDVLDWATGKGYDLSTPEGVEKLAQSYREAEKLAMSKAQEASELKKAMSQAPPQSSGDAVDPMLSDMSEFISDYRRDKMITKFKEAHPDWQKFDNPMGELLTQQVTTPYGVFTRSQLVGEGLLSLDEVYLMAKGSSPIDTQAIKDEAQNEVLQTLANTQRAGGSIANASNSNPKSVQKDPILDVLLSD